MLLRRLPNRVVGLFLALGSLSGVAAEILDNEANAIMLANQSKSGLMQNGNALQGSDANQPARSKRNSAIAEDMREAECGGIAIGNVRPAVGDHRQHQTTIIIRGNVINSNNKC